MQSYSDCHTLAQTRKRKLANNTYLECNPDGSFGIRLHSTQVVIYHADGRIELQSGGWQTVTTKARMNEFSPLSIGSDRGVWYVNDRGMYATPGRWTQVPYADGITSHPDGTFSGEGEDPRAQQKLRNRAKKFAKAYMNAFQSGDVPAPGLGDCFGCLMETKEGVRPMGGADHMLSHMEEGYFVPSMLLTAAKRFGVSRFAMGTLAAVWSGETPHDVFRLRANGASSPGDGIAREQLEKALRRHVYGELGLPV